MVPGKEKMRGTSWLIRIVRFPLVNIITPIVALNWIWILNLFTRNCVEINTRNNKIRSLHFTSFIFSISERENGMRRRAYVCESFANCFCFCHRVLPFLWICIVPTMRFFTILRSREFRFNQGALCLFLFGKRSQIKSEDNCIVFDTSKKSELRKWAFFGRISSEELR